MLLFSSFYFFQRVFFLSFWIRQILFYCVCCSFLNVYARDCVKFFLASSSQLDKRNTCFVMRNENWRRKMQCSLCNAKRKIFVIWKETSTFEKLQIWLFQFNSIRCSLKTKIALWFRCYVSVQWTVIMFMDKENHNVWLNMKSRWAKKGIISTFLLRTLHSASDFNERFTLISANRKRRSEKRARS